MPQLNTPDFLSQNAQDFFNIGKKRTKEIFANKPLENPFLWYHVSAPAVNLAFALELMIKAILLIENRELRKEDKIHALKELFLKISSDAKNEIIKILDSLDINKHKYPALMFSIEEYPQKKTQTQEIKTTEEIIIELLTTHDNSFISWRYSFELSEINSKIENIEFDFGKMIRFIEATSIYLQKILIEYFKETDPINSHTLP